MARQRQRHDVSREDWPISSSSLEDEIAEHGSDLFVELAEDAKQSYERFDCGYIQTPRIFHDFKNASREMEHTLEGLANDISRINKAGNMEKADGSTLSFFGGLLGIGGTCAAPYTLGTSLVLTGVGVFMSYRGSSASSEAEKKLESRINSKLNIARRQVNPYKERYFEWIDVAQHLGQIVEDLQDLFDELALKFGHFMRSMENVEHEDKSSYKLECAMKCACMFYGVAKTSTHVVRNFERISRVMIRVKTVRTILKASKNAGQVMQSAKGVVFRAAIGKPNVALTTTKQVIARGGDIASSVQKTETFTQSAKMASVAFDGSGKIVKTEQAVQVLGKTVTKETVKVTKTVSRVGLALGVAFAVYDLYEIDKSLEAAKSKCDAEKELRSCIDDVKQSADDVMSNVDVYKEVIKIKAFFEYLLNITSDRNMIFDGVRLPIERVRSFVVRIDQLSVRM